ncbi:hypothetical protein C7X25_22015 [Salmonella enterica subsp. enterica serovar Sandiego]|nr:hypothetical protein [Salmonella enterica subsp. enterica]EEE4266736.1 hypothetical protein [Salmonella enterica subsp. enterica serovar Sandiego]
MADTDRQRKSDARLLLLTRSCRVLLRARQIHQRSINRSINLLVQCGFNLRFNCDGNGV